MYIIILVMCMNLLNIKLEIKLNKYLYESGVISKTEFEAARSSLINRLTHADENDKINTNSNREMINNEVT